ncbi:hypothetical protein ACWGH3_21065 [Streptomyces sp. NPDC054884]|uniref:hypothetical protein n=1 Tax=Streptomyces sp. ME08-AFT2 TaxID=3028683 RepID=UPI0029B97B18|nr:hypothetical protein [Streptomyces sp. ME08-AFT2]MDX3310057.1 hypothetical protein [Streptomyces sp. ME08-AFT2]
MTTTRVDVRIRRLVLDLPHKGGAAREWDSPHESGSPHRVDPPHEVSRAALCAAVEAELSVLLGGSPGGGRDRRDGRDGRDGRGTPRPPKAADAHLTLVARAVALAVHRAMATGEPAGPQGPAGPDLPRPEVGVS